MLRELAAVALLVLPACRTRSPLPEASAAKFLVLDWAGTCKTGLTRIDNPEFTMCFATPERLVDDQHRETARLQFETSLRGWNAAIELLDGIPRPVSVKVAPSCDNVDLVVETHPGDYRANASCGIVRMGVDEKGRLTHGNFAADGTILHELGHAYVGLADTYVEGGTASGCLPNQPNAVMCNHDEGGFKLQPDDIAGAQEIYRGIFAAEGLPGKLEARLAEARDRINSRVKGCTLAFEAAPSGGLDRRAVFKSTAAPEKLVDFLVSVPSAFSSAEIIVDRVMLNTAGMRAAQTGADCVSSAPESAQLEQDLVAARAYFKDCLIEPWTIPTPPSSALGDVALSIAVKRGPGDPTEPAPEPVSALSPVSGQGADNQGITQVAAADAPSILGLSHFVDLPVVARARWIAATVHKARRCHLKSGVTADSLSPPSVPVFVPLEAPNRRALLAIGTSDTMTTVSKVPTMPGFQAYFLPEEKAASMVYSRASGTARSLWFLGLQVFNRPMALKPKGPGFVIAIADASATQAKGIAVVPAGFEQERLWPLGEEQMLVFFDSESQVSVPHYVVSPATVRVKVKTSTAFDVVVRGPDSLLLSVPLKDLVKNGEGVSLAFDAATPGFYAVSLTRATQPTPPPPPPPPTGIVLETGSFANAVSGTVYVVKPVVTNGKMTSVRTTINSQTYVWACGSNGDCNNSAQQILRPVSAKSFRVIVGTKAHVFNRVATSPMPVAAAATTIFYQITFFEQALPPSSGDPIPQTVAAPLLPPLPPPLPKALVVGEVCGRPVPADCKKGLTCLPSMTSVSEPDRCMRPGGALGGEWCASFEEGDCIAGLRCIEDGRGRAMCLSRK